MHRYVHCVVAAVFAVALAGGTGCSTGKPSAADIPPPMGLTLAGQAAATGVAEGYRVRPRDGMTSLRAIFESGGFPDTAKVDHVLHVRWDDDGPYSARVVDLKHVLETGDMHSDVLLSPNDVVFGPKTAIANADLWVRQYLIDLLPLREPTTRIDDFRP